MIKLATQAEEVGVPSGALNVVTGLGAEAGPLRTPERRLHQLCRLP
ncbi:MAG: hypothetical protein JO051_09200 [Acidobacteriaceae bacterium]|nr:hypothetical protein [Acidobacteriaceae bacterium]